MISKEYNYRPALQQLRENAGEGNYFLTIVDPDDDWDEHDVEDEEEMTDDEWEDNDEFKEEMLDFDKVSILSDERING